MSSFIAHRGHTLFRISLLLRLQSCNTSSKRMTTSPIGKTSTLIFRQLFDNISSTYTYVLADGTSKKAIIIDPVYDLVERDLTLIKELGLDLIYAANTHVHADHVTGTGVIKKKISKCQSIISKASDAVADIHVKNNDVIKIGDLELEVRSTPGHTNGCVTYVSHQHKMAFTGDALLIRGCGRTDFQQGCSEKLYKSVHSKIFSLPDDTFLYPAHDYKGQTVTTVAEEKKFNARLSKPKNEFIEIMKNLNLPKPAKIDEAVPKNLHCGLQ